MDIPLSLILDVFVAVLLVITIGYAVMLNKRLGTLRGDRAELQKLAQTFGQATGRAEESISELRATTEVLQERIKRAESLREDLVFLMERGNSTADRLEDLVRTARDDAGVDPKPQAKPAPAPVAVEPSDQSPTGPQRPAPHTGAADRAAPAAASDAERELLKALRSAG